MTSEVGAAQETGSGVSLTITKVAIAILGVGISCFQLYTGGFGVVEAYMQRTIHLMTLMTLAFLCFPTNRKWSAKTNAYIDLSLAALCLVIGVFLFFDHDRIVGREWYYGPMTHWDIIFGIMLMLLTLESARRVVGLALPVIALVFIAYCMFGSHLPYPFTIRTPPPKIFLDHMVLTPQAIFGVPVGVSATFVYLFILFGAFLERTGGGQFIIDFSMALVGRATGGPAKVAVVASTLFGTVSGHSVANVYGTGTFTIPLMKKMGYKAEFAGAVEAAASAGGQIMPPIMGAAAFIMAEIMGLPYLTICAAALIPALLYYLAVFSSTHVEALRMGLRGLTKEEVPPLMGTLKHGAHFFIPIALMITVLVMGYTPFKAAFMAIVALVVVAQFRKESRLSPRGFIETLIQGARNSIVIAVSCGCAGIVVGVLDITGLGIKFVTIVTELSMGIFPLAMILVMFSCLILGMGVPTAPAYIIAAMIAAPTLIQFGANPLAAHMFVFYSALLSAITPPVALAAYAGAAISGGNVMKTGIIASKLGFVKFLVPYMFVYNGAFLMMGTPTFIVWSFFTGMVGTIGLVVAMEGYFYARLSPLERALFALAGVGALIPEFYSDIPSLVLFGVLAWMNRKKKNLAASAAGA
ncbi:MAG: TRAP transporter permease [Desulfarculaceae bacterium]|nr:TRAP transporter permease [Desulfarculaceae bacterium]MCF8046766.1 TRAP transporter permease [Desulfarculaceae bacterium]MCF8124544.1 TRAP transporter permease [Desulfarculaceae bacterium]